MMRLNTNVLGSFVLDKKRIVKHKLFGDNVEEIASKLYEAEKSVCAEEKELVRWLASTGNKKVFVKNPLRFHGKGFNITFAEDKERLNLYALCDEIGYDSSKIRELINKVNRLITRKKLKVIEKDQLIIQAVKSLDDIDDAVNRLVERLREWYSLHYPELDYLMENHETYAKLVHEIGFRSEFTEQKLTFEPDFKKKITDSARESLGIEFTQDDMKSVRKLAEDVIRMYETKKEAEEYIQKMMQEIAPNISALAGPLVGARLIALAGSLKRMSIMPAGTIQVLGAEDAFFKFLKTGKKPPKHGIIFQVPEIRGNRKEKRGKIARTLAAKIAIASRADAFKGEFIGDELRKKFEERVKNIK